MFDPGNMSILVVITEKAEQTISWFGLPETKNLKCVPENPLDGQFQPISQIELRKQVKILHTFQPNLLFLLCW